MTKATPAKILKNARSCAACGNATMDRLSGQDNWDMLTTDTPDLHFRCSDCGAEEEIWNKGTIAAALLVGAGLLGSNLIFDSAFSLFSYIAANPGAVMQDVLADGIAGIVGFVFFTVLLGALFIMLPLLMLSYAGRQLYWRWRNPLTNLSEETTEVEVDAAAPPPTRPAKRPWHWWISLNTITRAMLIGLVAELSFSIIMHAANAFGAREIIAAILTGVLWWLLMTTKTLSKTPLWLVFIFFFVFLVPTSMFVDIFL